MVAKHKKLAVNVVCLCCLYKHSVTTHNTGNQNRVANTGWQPKGRGYHL